MPKPGHDYYSKIPGRIGEGTLTPEQLKELEELGLLADRDDQGVLLQVFTKPLGMHPCPPSFTSTRLSYYYYDNEDHPNTTVPLSFRIMYTTLFCTVTTHPSYRRSSHHLHRDHPTHWLRSYSRRQAQATSCGLWRIR